MVQMIAGRMAMAAKVCLVRELAHLMLQDTQCYSREQTAHCLQCTLCTSYSVGQMSTSHSLLCSWDNTRSDGCLRCKLEANFYW